MAFLGVYGDSVDPHFCFLAALGRYSDAVDFNNSKLRGAPLFCYPVYLLLTYSKNTQLFSENSTDALKSLKVEL